MKVRGVEVEVADFDAKPVVRMKATLRCVLTKTSTGPHLVVIAVDEKGEGTYLGEVPFCVLAAAGAGYDLTMNKVLCPCCRVALVPRRNPKGGTFLGCPNHAFDRCDVTYSPTEERFFGLPYRVARGSSKRSPAMSLRELVVHRFLATGAGTREEVERLIDDEGLVQVAALVA